ncbi:methylated-DNA--[protein]-cysteine S-methyltransferase [Treponema pectinovorum]|uniref:methylated-DNA--[protein]-cysteine S-methyltransferase n=1 Tax=Treponema pectinovorum TaxID=164 RepID=UPI0011F0E448|nr:methylated-DNA--[protein]-cysteine S-methyltransferase [Treponema pectinovorum]
MSSFFSRYKTPADFDDILIKTDGEFLTGLFFEGSKDAKKYLETSINKDSSIFLETCRWLDIYFSGKQPNFIPKYKIENQTPFREEVIEQMLKIPFGKTITYGKIAEEIARLHGVKKMSAQAVGGAVGWNPICIIVPCHRVVGRDNCLTGYGGGIKNKIALLKLEGFDTAEFSMPKKSQL